MDNDFRIKTDIEASMVQKVDNALHWINLYPLDNRGASFYVPHCCHGNKSPPKAFIGAFSKRTREFLFIEVCFLKT